MRVLVTGCAGFIGFFLAQALLRRQCEVVGYDNLNNYYEVSLKKDRLQNLVDFTNFNFIQGDLTDYPTLERIFTEIKPQRVVHLAAQAGVRHSIICPGDFAQSNLLGFLNILEAVRHYPVEHFVFASSSSVYGLNAKLPFSERDTTDQPTSLYGATKKANEIMAHSYAHLYGIPTTGLRFFTVYGPWGRPDMAPMLFSKAILQGEPIKVYNHGHHARDFTYIDDIVDGILRVLARPPSPSLAENASAKPPYRLYNIGNNNPVRLMDFISCLEHATGKTAVKQFLPMQPGDVETTFAAIDDLAADTGFRPTTSIDVGISKLVDWYRGYYRI